MTNEKPRVRLMAAGIAAAALALPAAAQGADIFCRAIACGSFKVLDDQKKSELRDPFFRLVLAADPEASKLANVEALIRGSKGQRRMFVVEEEIKDPRQPGTRRVVVDFIGKNEDAGFELGGNVMLSFSFSDQRLPEAPDLEAWGWDEVNGVYNYYKFDTQHPPGTPPGRSWKLAATSRDADQLSAQKRAGTCLACHASGVPIMKELHFPWNNWHSTQSSIDYLTRLTPKEKRWPVTEDEHFQDLGSAEVLEGAITGSIQNFNNRRFRDLVQRQADGTLQVADAKRVLRPLFETTEVNLASARQRSNLHPLAPTAQTGPSQAIKVPSSFFLASDVLRSSGISEGDELGSAAAIPAADYKAAIASSGVQIQARKAPQPVRGDTHFAWFAPEQGFVGANWIDTLLQNKLLSPAFVAAAAGADLKNPIFSERRAKLLAFIPASFTAIPGEPHPDALARAVVTALKAVHPAAGSAEGDFLAALESADPVETVRARVLAYKDEVSGALANPATRNSEIQRLFDLLIQRRRQLLDHPVFGNLKESEALLPLP